MGFDRDTPQINISSLFDDLKADADGHYLVRVFPGRGSVYRVAPYNVRNRQPFHRQSFDVKPGETLTVDIGGGGIIVSGRVMIPLDDTPSPVDWRYARVEARPFVPILVLPNLSEAAETLQRAVFAAAMTFSSLPSVQVGAEMKELIDQWAETPEGKAIIEQNQEVYDELTRYLDLWFSHLDERNNTHRRIVASSVDDEGSFRLDDLTPGVWTLTVVLNFPRVQERHHDFIDVWRKNIEITIPDLPELRDKPLELGAGAIHLGFDRSERRGPSER